MKPALYSLCFLLAFSTVYSQDDCEDANSDLIYAYSHVKSAYDSNNISHLKHYANRSLEAFERSKEKLTKCGCDTAYNLAYDAAELLARVEGTKTYEDGRFYVKRARDIGRETITALDKCTVLKDTNGNDELDTLQQEQERLKLQQEALKAKEEEIRIKLAQQEEKEFILKKKQLISTYETIISSHIKIYNKSLKVCNCTHEVIEKDRTAEAPETKSLETIKVHYVNQLKTITSMYQEALSTCK